MGARVLDLTDETGAFATRLLADLGCEVVRSEPPEGCRLRHLEPRGLHHAYLDAGKQSVVDVPVDELVRWADAVVETERLDHERLLALNPRVVHTTITPFGLDGAWTSWQGNDLIACAASGLAWVCGKPGDPPNQPGGDQASKMAGLVAAYGTQLGLRAGGPLHLDVSMQVAAAMATVQTSSPHFHFWKDTIPGRPGLTAVHACRDGRFATVMVRPDRLDVFLDWCAELGVAVEHDRETLAHPVHGVVPLARVIRQVVAHYTRDEFYERAWSMGILGLPVHTLPDLAESEHLEALGAFVKVGGISFPRSPLHDVAVPLRPAPAMGEHTATLIPTAPVTVAPGRALVRAMEGVRVLDFCWVLAGPFGTRLLANFGADVIRVEDGRGWEDQLPDGDRDRHLGVFHNAVNTGKRSISVDPTSERGRALLLDLVEHVDIVTNNYRPGAVDQMGFGHDALRARNPRIITLHMPGCGRSGPWRDRGSYGNMVAAASGISSLTGFPGRSPRGLGVAYPDFTGPYLLAMTAVAALERRDATGEGGEYEVNQLTGMISLIGVEWLDFMTSGTAPPMRANRDPNWCPHGVYPAAGDDEWVAIAIGDDDGWAELCGLLALDPASFRTHADRKANEDDLDALVAAWTSSRSKWDIAETLQAVGIAAAPVEHLADSMTRDPYLPDWVEHVRQPTHPDIAIPIPGEAIRERGRPTPLRPAHVVGADTDDVLRELLGLDEATIAALRTDGTVWSHPSTVPNVDQSPSDRCGQRRHRDVRA